MDAKAAAIKYVAINHRRRDILVSQQFLDRPNIVAPFEQIRRKRVPQAVRCRRFGNTAPPAGALEKALKRGLMQMSTDAQFQFQLQDIGAMPETPTAMPIHGPHSDTSGPAHPVKPLSRRPRATLFHISAERH